MEMLLILSDWPAEGTQPDLPLCCRKPRICLWFSGIAASVMVTNIKASFLRCSGDTSQHQQPQGELYVNISVSGLQFWRAYSVSTVRARVHHQSHAYWDSPVEHVWAVFRGLKNLYLMKAGCSFLPDLYCSVDFHQSLNLEYLFLTYKISKHWKIMDVPSPAN